MKLRSVLLSSVFLTAFNTLALAQKTAPPAADSAGGKASPSYRVDREAVALVNDLLTQMPSQQTVMQGTLNIRDGSGKRVEVPVKYTILAETNGWRGVYETKSAAGRGAERLEIIHRFNKPKEYLYTPASAPSAPPRQPISLTGKLAAVPFARSDYWLTDLGMEFLHWPEQRLIKDAKIKMRSSRPCKVLESVNPRPSGDDYSRVVTWLDAESGAPLYAEGYDRNGKRLKIYSLHGFTKVDGYWQAKELEMITEKTDSRSRLEFVFE